MYALIWSTMFLQSTDRIPSYPVIQLRPFSLAFYRKELCLKLFPGIWKAYWIKQKVFMVSTCVYIWMCFLSFYFFLFLYLETYYLEKLQERDILNQQVFNAQFNYIKTNHVQKIHVITANLTLSAVCQLIHGVWQHQGWLNTPLSIMTWWPPIFLHFIYSYISFTSGNYNSFGWGKLGFFSSVIHYCFHYLYGVFNLMKTKKEIPQDEIQWNLSIKTACHLSLEPISHSILKPALKQSVFKEKSVC